MSYADNRKVFCYEFLQHASVEIEATYVSLSLALSLSDCFVFIFIKSDMKNEGEDKKSILSPSSLDQCFQKFGPRINYGP